jgi:hypothetical protein
MRRGLTYLGLGAGLMYFFDPNCGRRRRALARDQGIHWMHEIEDAVGVVSRDLSNRTAGLTAEAKSLFSDGRASEETIEARVRAALGRAVSHPRALQVEAHGGRVSLSGPILASEVENLLATVRAVRGVTGVENQLEVHQQAGHHPALQGGVPRSGVRSELFQETWSPTTRLLVGLAGVMVGLKVMRSPELTGLAIGALGVGLAACGLANASQADRRHRSSRDVPRDVGSPGATMNWVSP